MVEVRRRRPDSTPAVGGRDALGLAALVVGLVLLMAPLALQVFAVASVAAAWAAWRLSGWLEQWLPEDGGDEDVRRGR
jgi:membrane protein implicated in regulation of membrane protease activity